MVVSFIGLGEVGSTFSTGLAEKGVKVKGYDLKFHDPVEKDKFIPYGEAGVELVKGPKELIEGSDVIFAATSCAQAVETAEMYKPYLKNGQIYIDLNSAIPDVKKKLSEMLSDTCSFLDGAIMNFPKQFGLKCLIVVSGPMAKQMVGTLNSIGMNTSYIGEEIGQASAFKVVRSIFTKGLESVLIECMQAARTCGIADQIFDSVVSYLSDKPVRNTLEVSVITNPVHVKRRALEIDGVNEMLEKLGVNNIISKATSQKLHWLEEADVKGRLGGKEPVAMMEVIDELVKQQKGN